MSVDSRYLCDFNIAGMRYWDGATVLGKLKPGKRLRLVAEPQNPYDHDAVALYRKDTKLGYVPKAQNSLIAQMIRFGHEDVFECCVIAVDDGAEAWNQVRAGIYVTDKRPRD